MTNTLAILVHGFNVRDGGRATIGQLETFFSAKGIPCIVFNYHWLGVFGTYAKNGKIARRISKAAESAAKAGHRVVAVGHSNGCAILHRATIEQQARIEHLIYINPALDKNRAPGGEVNRLDVWHSPSDKPVKIAKWLPKHPWGEMGATGYDGDDERIFNHNKEKDYPVSSKEHSDMFILENLSYFGTEVLKDVK